jgi:hypothetical protein
MTKKQLVALTMLIGFSLITASCTLIQSPLEETENFVLDKDIPTQDSTSVEDNVETPPETKTEEDQESNSSLEGREVDEEALPFPVVEDAYDIEDFFGTYTYLTDMSVDQVTDFYRTEMEAAGYVTSAEAIVANGTIFNFKKKGSIVTMNVFENDDGSVLIRYVEGNP